MNKLPAFQFYPGDWRKDTGVQSLDFFTRGVWFEILCLMHESERRGILTLNGKAMPEDALARLLGLDKQILTTTLTTLLTHGVASLEDETGALMCRRMVRDENLRQVRKNAGKMGGNPVLVKQNPTTGVKQNTTPSSSSSISSSTSNNSCESADRPSQSEVEFHAERIGLAKWKALDWFQEMEACGWKDHNGREVQKWQPMLARVKTKWEADGRPDAPPVAKGYAGGKPKSTNADSKQIQETIIPRSL